MSAAGYFVKYVAKGMEPHSHIDGAGGSWPVRLICRRWDGGAEYGKTHVFTDCMLRIGGQLLSMQCVTDDFGNLVEVPA